MGASVASVPGEVIVRASVPVNVTVSNTAPVQFSNGADRLDYTVLGSGSVTGSANGSNLAALAPGNLHSLALNTSTPGPKTGNVNVSSANEAVANGSFTQSISTTVLAHSNPSLSASGDINVATIDFGIRGRGLGVATQGFGITNALGLSAFQAGLDLDSFVAGGSTAITTDALVFTNLPAGLTRSFTASLSDAANGTFTTTYTFNLSDRDLPGATAHGPLTLVFTGIVATPGDADLSGSVDFDDYVRIDSGYNGELSGWVNGDFDNSGAVDFDDYVLIDASFNAQEGTLRRAQAYLDGNDRSLAGMDAPGLIAVVQHFQQFGIPYAAHFLAAVPEPSSAAVMIAATAALARVRRRRA
jgi:hypothetical protein